MNALSILFPGVWVHELSHALACVVSGVKVHRIHVETRAGMVVHDKASARKTWAISLAPFVIGTILSFLFLGAAKNAWEQSTLVSVMFGWLGLSIGFHSIPSVEDALNIPEAIGRQLSSVWKTEKSFLFKVAKAFLYIVTWPIALITAACVWIVNLSLIFRWLWVAGLMVIA